MKVGCFIFKISIDEFQNFSNDDFFVKNAINSFKKFHPNVDLIYVNDDNFQSILQELNISEYYDNIGILRIQIIKELMKKRHYNKIIMLGADTITCGFLDEFLNNNTPDMICSSGPPSLYIKTEYWKPKIVEFEIAGSIYKDVDLINADVVCFNNVEIVELLFEKSLEVWTDHAEQGGMNYLYQNQKEFGVNISIIDFPYVKTNVLYNVRSKGLASGGNQMYNGNLYNGNYKDKNSKIIANQYPTAIYYVKDGKLFTTDHKQIKVFHYAEGLAVKSKIEYDECMNEIKKMWFNKETIDFLTKECDCKF
jgi:hypothetical protein